MPTAVITGGTLGLGAAYAHHLAERGFDLVLVARDQSRLEVVAEQLGRRSGVIVEAIAADLTDPRERALVELRLTDPDRPVEILVNNAGTECPEVFGIAPLESLLYEVDLNIVALMCLTRAALPGMTARGSGAIINVASFAGYLPPGGCAYGASKAWVLTFTDTVAASLSGTGVRMLAVCAGRVRNEATSAPERSPLWLTPEQVVRSSMIDLAKGRTLSTPGWLYRGLVSFLESPRSALRLAAAAAGRGRQRCARLPDS